MENKKQTAVEWLKKELEEYGDPQYCELTWNELDELCEQAKEMEKQQIIDIVEKSRATGLTAEYLLLTYGSDEIEKSEKPINLTSSQTEISDEEIKEVAYRYKEDELEDTWEAGISFMDGAKWYREQLKKKQ